jgi:hypothetical protein
MASAIKDDRIQLDGNLPSSFDKSALSDSEFDPECGVHRVLGGAYQT